MKRQAYGYRDMPFFKLKLLSLHDSSYPFSGRTVYFYTQYNTSPAT